MDDRQIPYIVLYVWDSSPENKEFYARQNDPVKGLKIYQTSEKYSVVRKDLRKTTTGFFVFQKDSKILRISLGHFYQA